MKTSILIKRISLTLFGIILFLTSYCQENYQQGYIVRLSGDTIQGYIDYRNWDRNPDKISFKKEPGSAKEIYTPMVIKAFGVQNEKYESGIVETEISLTATNDLDYNNQLKIKTDSAFLQTMIKGSKSLYHYKNKFGKSQFYIKQDSVYKLLIYKRYLKDLIQNNVIAENNRYLGQLSLYLQECPIIQSQLKHTTYNKESLEQLFQFYYNYTHTGVKFQKKTEKIVVETGGVAGLSSTSLKMSSDGLSYLVNANYQQSLNFATGLFCNLVIPRNHGKLSVYNELNYSSYKVNGQFKETDPISPENKYSITYTTFGYTYLKLYNILRYKYPIGDFFIYLNAGISNGFAIGETNYKKIASKVLYY